MRSSPQCLLGYSTSQRAPLSTPAFHFLGVARVRSLPLPDDKALPEGPLPPLSRTVHVSEMSGRDSIQPHHTLSQLMFWADTFGGRRQLYNTVHFGRAPPETPRQSPLHEGPHQVSRTYCRSFLLPRKKEEKERKAVKVAIAIAVTMDSQQAPAPGTLTWRLSSHPITLLTFLAFRSCKLSLPQRSLPNSRSRCLTRSSPL